jgi:hypothetical protein
MNRTNSLRAVVLVAASVLALVVAPATALAQAPPGPVDKSRLVPSLSPTFTPWRCKAKQSGPVCTGERHLTFGWEPTDFPCSVPVYGARDERRRQTRFYDWNYLNYDRSFETNDVDWFSTSPAGPATGSIATTIRFKEHFGVPGDDTTRTIVSDGVLYDIRAADGPALWRAVGTLVEPPGEVGTFTGRVTDHGVSTPYVDAPFPQVLPDDTFVSVVCEAATGTP